jgi:hypothetical protein
MKLSLRTSAIFGAALIFSRVHVNVCQLPIMAGLKVKGDLRRPLIVAMTFCLSRANVAAL